MDKIVGYFYWRRGRRGAVVPEKLLKDHRDWTKASPNGQTVEGFTRTLLAEHPLTQYDWELSLSALAVKYPAPETANAPQ